MSIWIRFAAFLTVASMTVPAIAQRSTPVQVLHPSGLAGDQFGEAVAIDGDTMIVGALGDDVGANADQGTAHIYRWTGSGWAFEATLAAADGATTDWFGRSVAISGDTVVVGSQATFATPNGLNNAIGSAYVFSRSGTTWTQQTKLTAADGTPNDDFGQSVAISGNTIIVGARNDVGTNADQGSAYVFIRSGTTWMQQAKLIAADGAATDAFGRSVALEGDTAIVGAYLDDVGANADQGSAYVFTRSGTTWTQKSKLTAADGAANDYFGFSVAVSGDTAIIGVLLDDVGGKVNQGSAYVFTRSGTSWTQQAQLTAAGSAGSDYFGIAVALSGETAIVGATNTTVNGNSGQGVAYVFVRSANTWTEQAKFSAPDGAANDSFGSAVALSGDIAIVGAEADSVFANTNQGSAWAFFRVGPKWLQGSRLLASDGAAGDIFGFSVAASGDTAVAGASNDDVGANPDQGSVYVFTRAGTNWIQQSKLIAADGAATDRFGVSIGISGDTLIVGANGDDVGPNSNQGSVYVFVRSGNTWTLQAKLTAADGASGDEFGTAVAISGETVLVGAVVARVGNIGQGAAYVFTRSGTTWTQQAKLVAADGAAGDSFGCSVAVSADSAIVGANYDTVGVNGGQGSAYVFVRTGTTWTQQAKLTAADGAANDWFGYSVALAGDTAIVGAQRDDVGASVDQGSAYVYIRSGPIWTQQVKLIASDGAAGDNFGYSVVLAGDISIVGATGTQDSAHLFVRSGSTWSRQTLFSGARSGFGSAVALSANTAIIGAYGDGVGAGTTFRGSAWTFDFSSNDDFAVVQNDVTNTTYVSIADAFLPALSGQQITATEAAWRAVGSVNTLGRSLALIGSGDIRTPSSSVLDLGGSSMLVTPVGSSIEIFGQLRTAGFVDLSADSFRLGSRGIMTTRTGSSIAINAPTAKLDGQTRLEQGASLTFSGGVTAIGPTTANANSALTTGGAFTNIDTFNITAGTLSTPLFYNRAQTNIFGSSAVFGSFTNEAGATTTIRSGTLFVFGSFTNNGTIVGTVCSGCLQDGGGAAASPGLDVGGDLSLGVDANLNLPFTGAIARVGGNYDASINSNTRYDMAIASLQLEGSGSEQTLEAMSKDLGASAAGLDRRLAGHYPIGTLEIGPSTSTVRLVDTRDNDGLGQSSCEAIYVGTLKINSGSRLINTGCSKIYYTTLINNGTIDVPANVIPLAAPCPADLNADTIVDDADFQIFVVAYNILDCTDPAMPAGCPSDLNADAIVDDADFQVFVVAYNAVLCP